MIFTSNFNLPLTRKTSDDYSGHSNNFNQEVKNNMKIYFNGVIKTFFGIFSQIKTMTKPKFNLLSFSNFLIRRNHLNRRCHC